jgi:hypothetical protein
MFVSPLIESLRRLEARKDSGALGLYLVMFFIFVFLSCLPFSATVQKMAMSKFHLTLRPFGRWAAVQFVPSMYNFQNEFYWSFDPGLSQGLRGVNHYTVNHYPLRLLFFTTDRRPMLSSRPLYLYLRSTYRGRERVTSYLNLAGNRHIQIQFLNAYENSQR